MKTYCAWSLLLAAPCNATVPPWACPVTTLSVLAHDQPDRLPVSKPGLASTLTSAAAGPMAIDETRRFRKCQVSYQLPCRRARLPRETATCAKLSPRPSAGARGRTWGRAYREDRPLGRERSRLAPRYVYPLCWPSFSPMSRWSRSSGSGTEGDD